MSHTYLEIQVSGIWVSFVDGRIFFLSLKYTKGLKTLELYIPEQNTYDKCGYASSTGVPLKKKEVPLWERKLFQKSNKT